MLRAVVLQGVTGYDSVKFLDSHARPQRPVYAMDRVRRDIAERHIRGEFK